MERRRFLQTGVAGLAMTALTFKPSIASAQTQQKKLGIVQGATGETATQISVLVPLQSRYKFKVVSAEGETKSPALLERFTFPKHDDAIINISFDELCPDVDYIFIVSDDLGNTLDQRMFSTLSIKSELSFTVSSCMDHSRHSPEIWQSLAATNPDVAFFIGDAVYADGSSSGVGMPADPAQLWRTFCESRKTLEFYKLNRLIPLFAVWDDHDFGANDKGKEFMYAEESQRNFHIFFPHNAEICPLMELGPGISKKIKLGSQSFYLMDDRTFREEDGSTDSYAHWGKDQHEWLLQGLKNDNFAWIMNGSQIFSEHHLKEAMAGHHKNHFNQLMTDLKSSPAKVLFYSGDVHFSEISKIEKEMLGYETLELTSSSMHSSTFPKLPEFFKNPRRVEGKATAEHNFNYVKTSSAYQQLNLNVSCINKNQKEIYNYNYQL